MQRYAINTRSMALHIVTGRSMYPVAGWRRFTGACADWLMEKSYARPYPPIVELTEDESRAFRVEKLQARV